MRFPDALDRAITSAGSSSDASFEEAIHELGITTEEGTALAVAEFEQADSPSETLVIALLAGLLVGREPGRPRDAWVDAETASRSPGARPLTTG